MKNVFLAGVAIAAICTGPAIAADVPAKARVSKAIAPLYDWTGWYAGYNVGLGASQISASVPSDGGNDLAGLGPAGGVQGGYNQQFGPHLVAGIEGDIGYLGINRSVLDFNDIAAFGVKTDAYGTLRGRLGYSTGPSLFYLSGGIAVVRLKNTFESFVGFNSSSRTQSGFTFGAGLETMLGGNWSAKVEYLNIDAGNVSVDSTQVGQDTAVFDDRFHIFRFGANYRFGGPASVNALPAHNWSGFYAGVNAGAAVSQIAVNAPTSRGPSADIAASGFVGGAQAGYNWQPSPNWLIGIEGDIGLSRTQRSFIDFNDSIIQFGARSGLFGTLRGRLGYVTGPALLYITAGPAFLRVSHQFDDSDSLGGAAVTKSRTAAGSTAGGGIEAVLTHNWTAKAEYLYVDLDKANVFNPNVINTSITAAFDNRFHLFRMGLNYKFGG
jgi:outer membrane immunogenic protein